MAEDENVDIMSMNAELAERLGVVPAPTSNEGIPKPGFRARGRSPILNASSTPRPSCPSVCRSHESSEDLLVPELSYFIHLLPQEVITADKELQARLFQLVFDAGVKAYHHLLQYVIATGTSPSESTSSNSSETSWSTSRAFHDVPVLEQDSRKSGRFPSVDSDTENMSMMERIDQAYETMIEVGDADIVPVGNAPEATPQLVANTLGLFAGAALRRPPTRAVECVMAASQESNTAQSDVDRHDIYENQPNLTENSFSSCEDGLLILSCAAGFVELVTEILSLRHSTLFSSDSDVTPLMEAAAAGSHAVVRKLLELKADVNAVSQSNNSALIYAAAAGQAECVRLLLGTGIADVTLQNDNGHDALMEAASSGNVDVVKMLVDAGARPHFINMHSEFKESPLTLASYKGHVDVVTFLLDLCNAFPDVNYQEEEMHTALMEASMDGHYEVAKVLLDAGAPPNMASESFESPLTLACCGGHDVLARMLLDAGAYIEEPNDESYTPLMEAAREGHGNVVKVLLEHGANVNAQTEETGETALTVAACGGYTDVLEELVKHGGDLELGGNTPLMEAAQEGHAQTVMYIVKASKQKGMCPNFISHAATAVGLSAENGHLDVIEILFNAGADLSTEIDGRTPLMKAAKNGNAMIVQYLINHNVDVNTQSSHHDATALLLACAAGHKDIVKILLHHGADPNIELKDGISCVLEAARNGFVEIVELILDHNGISANVTPAQLPNVPKSTQGSNSTSNPSQQKVAPLRRKKIPPKNLMGLPDSSTNGPPIYTHAFPAAAIPSQHIDASKSITDVYSNPEFAREYYAWLAGIYNSRIGDQTAFVSTTLPPDLTCNQIMGHLENLQKMMQQLTQSDENWIRPDHMEFAMHRSGSHKQISQPRRDGTEMANGVRNPEKSTGVAECTSAKFLASIYELGKKNFAGLPLPTSGKQKHPSNTPGPSTSLPASSLSTSAAASLAQSAQAASQLNALNMDQMAELMAFFKTNPNQDGEDIMSQITAPLSPEHSKATKKKIMEIFNNWESYNTYTQTQVFTQEFAEECRKLCPDLTRNTPNNDLSAVLEQQTAALNETLKVLRPTVTSLPGGVVAGATTTANLPPVAFPTSNMTMQPPGHNMHRRTHSEGGDPELSRQNALPKNGGIFNVDKATESNNDTPLSLACSNGHKDMVSVLVSRGANIEHRDKKGFTPLILASTGGHVNVVEALLTAGANIEAQSERTKDTALSLACSGGRKEVVELLLAKGANKEHRNVSDYTPLSLAASGGYVDIVNMLLNSGAEINSRTGSKLGISPLMLAAMNGHKDATRVLLEKGSDINAQIETNRNTALTLACFQGRTDVVRLLLQYNANVEHRAKTGLTPLMEAANGGYVEVGELLLENYADPNTTPVPSSRDTALTIAADKGHDKFVEMLLKHGATIDARNKKGCTALWLACHGGHLDTVQVLIRHNGDVDAQDNRKVSPLMIAFRKGYVRIVSYLVNHVKQYPSDQEMERYMATLAVGDSGKSIKDIQELTKNCEESMNIIKKAKTAQAEQANKAAEDLLALLAEEEERAKNKKKKKAQKREEKKQKQKVSKVKSPMVGTHKSDDESDDESEVNNASREENTIASAELRVPHVIETPLVNTAQPVANPKQKKQARRSRQDVVKAPTTIAPAALTVTIIPKSLAVSPSSPIIAPPKGSPTEEWVKANPTKKKTAQKKTAAPHQSKVQDFFSDESGAYGGWKDVELSRRRSNTLTVCNTVIARVIGRGGTNINAIREATGASIEVEKQNTKRDQPERQICIRGTAETVRNATCMINGLIADNDIAVNDIIRQVLRGNISVASSSSESGKVTYLPEKVMASATTVKANPGTTPITTNVWQQRMAARAAMQQAQSKEYTSNPYVSDTSSRVSPKIGISDDTQEGINDTCRRTSPISSPTLAPVATVPPLLAYSTEEDLRKAPGYRPHTAPSNTVSNDVISFNMRPDKDADLSECCGLTDDKPLLPIGRGFARAPGAKIISEESDVSKTSSGKDLGRLSFLEKPEIADIWKGDGKDSANEPAWGSQLLLGNGIGNMLGNLNLVSPEWSSSLSTNDFNSTAPSNLLNNKVPSTTTYDWIGTSATTITQSNPLYSRPTATSRAAPIPTPTMPVAATRESSVFQQLAAQLINQQNTGNQPASAYYSNSYPENPMNSVQSQTTAHKSYLQAYQNANQEFENLNNLLSSYSSHYGSNGEYGQSFAGGSTTSRPLPSRPSSYAPPPGFANVTPTVPVINSNSPVPLMRPYYNTNQPQLSQNTSAFSAYGQQPHQSQQQNNWSKLNANGAPGSSWNSGSWN